MGTVVEIKVWTDDEIAGSAAVGEALAEVRKLEARMTTWREDSEVSRVNASAGGPPVPVSLETFEVIARSTEFSRASGGVFDVSFYALKGLWKFDQDLEKRVPDVASVSVICTGPVPAWADRSVSRAQGWTASKASR